MGTLLGSPQRHTATMNAFLYFSALVASCMGAPQQITLKGHGVPTLVRAPAHDSASIEHHRLGGNFAYSTAEAHAFAEATHTHIPSPIAVHQPDPIINTHHVAQPIFKNIPTFGTQQISAPVAQTVGVPVAVERTHVAHGVAHVPASVPVQGHAVVGHAAVGHAGVAGYGIAPAAYPGHAAHVGY